jgi:phage-related protein
LRAAIVDAFDQLSRDAPGVSLRQIRGRLWEIRVSAGTAARIFYCAIEAGETCILLHAYRKQTQKAPAREIAVAERRLREVLE